jgi:hypothetical protein
VVSTADSARAFGVAVQEHVAEHRLERVGVDRLDDLLAAEEYDAQVA